MNKNKTVVIKGKVYDPILDCGHLIVISGDFDILHDVLHTFEEKEVVITIKEVRRMEAEQK